MTPEAGLPVARRAAALFTGECRARAVVVASAPGRVNLIGEHTDYHGGPVLPVGLHLRAAAAVGPGPPDCLTIVSEQLGRLERAWPLGQGAGDWSDYVAGVALLARIPAALRGLTVAIASDVPLGMGLSSSAAMTVAAAAALAAFAGEQLEPIDLARRAYAAERSYAGMPCGVMDQLVAVLARAGHALLIECATLQTRQVPVPPDLLLVDSGERRELRSSPYAERRAEGLEALAILQRVWPSLATLADLPPSSLPVAAEHLPDRLLRRVRHVVTETARTRRAAEVLEAGGLEEFGALVNQSHDSLARLYECSSPALDAIVTAARALPEVLGARLVGAGWGGSVLVVCRLGSRASVEAALARAGPWRVMPVLSGEGARLEK